MSAVWIILVAIAVWAALIAIARLALLPWLRRGPRGELAIGVLWRILRLYNRVVHRVQYRGFEELRNQIKPGSLIVVSNHTGAIDPLLIQAGCRFHIRWMMASEMMSPLLRFIWRTAEPIPVDRDGRDSGPAREAIRHVQAGGVIGIFPEGRIVRPPEQIRPFFQGVGLIVGRAKAPVLLVWVSGTAKTTKMWRSILTPSRARVQFVELIDFKHQRDSHLITRKLREHLAQVSGWPLNNEPVPPSIDE